MGKMRNILKGRGLPSDPDDRPQTALYDQDLLSTNGIPGILSQLRRLDRVDFYQ